MRTGMASTGYRADEKKVVELAYVLDNIDRLSTMSKADRCKDVRVN